MASDYYTHGAYPATNAAGRSADMRSELDLIDTGFAKLPQLTGNAFKIPYVTAAGAAWALLSGNGLLKLSSSAIPSIAVSGTDYEAGGAVATHAALTSGVHGISAYGATLIDDATAADARTTLGLGSIATQASSSVSITGGSITGITDLAVADGGTGASDASTARTNLGLGTAATQNTGTSGTNVPLLDGANTWSATQTLSGTAVIAGTAGSASAPMYSASGDSNTGSFFPAADTWAVATGGSERARIDSAGRTGLGVTPYSWSSVYGATLDVSSGGSFVATTAGAAQITGNLYFNNSSQWIYKNNGGGVVALWGTTGFSFSVAASGTAGGTATVNTAFSTDLSGNATFVLGKFGYGAGAGGSATQLTNKATGITINKPSGAFVTSNAALAAGATVSFTFTNSFISNADTIDFNVAAGATIGAYDIGTASITSGSCVVYIHNRTAGSLSEAIQVNFAVKSGSTT